MRAAKPAGGHSHLRKITQIAILGCMRKRERRQSIYEMAQKEAELTEQKKGAPIFGAGLGQLIYTAIAAVIVLGLAWAFGLREHIQHWVQWLVG